MTLPFRTAFAAALAFVCLACAPAAVQTPPAAQSVPSAVPPEEPPPPYPELTGAEAEALRDVVRQYQAAVNRRDGAAAARLVTRETRAYYGRMRDMAVSAPEAAVRAAPLMDRVSILLYRHRVPAAELRALAPEAAFARTIEGGWVAASEEDPLAEGSRAFGEGDRAVLRFGGDEVPFLREDGAWRWDMMPMILGASDEFSEGLESQEEEDEFVLFVLQQSDGRAPSPDIWQPLP